MWYCKTQISAWLFNSLPNCDITPTSVPTTLHWAAVSSLGARGLVYPEQTSHFIKMETMDFVDCTRNVLSCGLVSKALMLAQ